MNSSPTHVFPFGNKEAAVYPDVQSMGKAAAKAAADIIRETLKCKPLVRIMIGTGNSQDTTIEALTEDETIDWKRVVVFHMDEYVGLPMEHPASFRRWLKDRVADKVHPVAVHYLNGDNSDTEQEINRYTNLLLEDEMDMSFIGFGENGHIAFNDPHVADFNDPHTVKIVDLDQACRLQQVGEGHYVNLEMVPSHAFTVTCTGLLRANHLVCVVPEQRKAQAVLHALKGPLSTDCPGSIVRTHPSAQLFLDTDSASLLEL